MNKHQKLEEINKKCLLLMELGFKIHHGDSNVEYNGVFFDFSSTACDPVSILKVAMECMYKTGLENGRNEIQNDLKKLLNI